MAKNQLVHIVDDEDAIRRSASYMLKTSGYSVQTWASGPAFLQHARDAPFECVLLDVRMPGLNGLEVQLALQSIGVTTPVVIMTGHGDIGTAVRAMKAGAVDFIEKPFQKYVLINAIEAAFERAALRNNVASRTAEAQIILKALTPRERDVLEGLAQGLPNKTIAHDLGISPRTVEVHRANMMLKLEVHSLSDALRIAFAAGLGS